MLYQKEHQAVRGLLGLIIMRVLVVVLWMLLDKMMHAVRAGQPQEGEECQSRTERTV